MALADAWTNKDATYFTSGTLADIDGCIDALQEKLGRGTLSTLTTPKSTDVRRWLIRAKQELAEAKLFTWRRRYVTLTCTAGTYIYSLPLDYSGQYGMLRDTTNDKNIPIVSPHQFDALIPDASESTGGGSGSYIATIKDRELWLWPKPGADVLEFEIYRSGDDVTSVDFSWLPQIDRWRCIDFALAESFEALHDFEKAGYYRSKWDYDLNKAKLADGKKKWTTMGYRARSAFQA